MNEVQVVCTVLSTSKKTDPDVAAMIGTSAALAISGIPFDGPIGAARAIDQDAVDAAAKVKGGVCRIVSQRVLRPTANVNRSAIVVGKACRGVPHHHAVVAASHAATGDPKIDVAAVRHGHSTQHPSGRGAKLRYASVGL